MKKRIFLISLAIFFHAYGISFAEQFIFHREHVLGTSMEWIVDAPNKTIAEQSEHVVLVEVDRLDRIFSRYREDSDLVRWQNRELLDNQISSELTDVLVRSEEIRVLSSGAFDIRAGALDKLWKHGIDVQTAPSLEQRRNIVERFKQAPYSIAERKIVRGESSIDSYTLDAIAKGYILDRACEAAMQSNRKLVGASLKIGGDMRTVGTLPIELRIDNPFHPVEGGEPIAVWKSNRELGVATSGGYRRFGKIGSQKVSHLFDPRTGLPVDCVASVTVLAPNAMDADALATAISVLGVDDGLQLIERMEGRACLIVSMDGTVSTSNAWPGLVGASFDPPAKLVSSHPNETKQGLHVWFELAKVGGSSYRRPYVAVWLEDTEGFPVKTALLWMQTEQPGPRWHRDLTRWFRNDRARKLAEKSDLIGSSSGATRGPGEYETYFDGTDNLGKRLAPGKYTLFIEAARENGTYQIIKQTIEWGDARLPRQDLKGNTEVSKAAFEFVPIKGN